MQQTPNATNYQRVRLWSGIFSIGTNLGLIWAFYVVSLLVSPQLLEFFDAKVWLVLPVAAMLALGLVFDILSGFAAETALERTRQEFKLWLRDWFLVSLRVAPALYFGLWVSIWLRFLNWSNLALFGIGATVFWLLWTLLLPAFLPRAWRLKSDETREFEGKLHAELANIDVPALPITWIESEDESTVNGAIPPLGRAQIWLSANVSRGLTPRQAALLIRRDFYFRRTKKHLLNVVICISWLILGLVFARLMPARDALRAALGGAAIVTTWCFVALFVWPHLNRVWMSAADRDLLNCAPREEIETLLRRVQELNMSDSQLSAAKVSVFHPIPDLNRRLEGLK
ncbi:MAG TPA: hypothetical protein VGB45_02275 [Abditibacterium sp.]